MKWISKSILLLITVKIIIESVNCEFLPDVQVYKGEDTTEKRRTEITPEVIPIVQNDKKFIENNSAKITTSFQTTSIQNNSGQSVRFQVYKRITEGPQAQTGRIKRHKQTPVKHIAATTSRTFLVKHTSKPTRKQQNNDPTQLWTHYLLLWT